MSVNFKKSDEYKFLLDVMFKSDKIDYSYASNINYDIVVKLASSYLLLPNLYFHLKHKKLLGVIPIELVSYLENIYNINLNRNKILIKEINSLRNLLNDAKVKHIFFKGAELLDKKIFKDLGVRMVGDIDFLVDEVDINRVKKMLDENNFNNSFNYKIINKRDLPKYTSKSNIFALEPHTEILSYSKRKVYNSNSAFKDYKTNKYLFYLKVCVLNNQINDHGHLYSFIGHRSIQDFLAISKNIKSENIGLENIYMKRFFVILNHMGISELKIQMSVWDKLYLKRHILMEKYKLIWFINLLICRIFEKTPKKIFQILEFMINKNYREYIFKKYKS